MRFRLIVSTVFLICFTAGLAQDSLKMLTLEDCVYRLKQPEELKDLQWRNNESFSYLETDGQGLVIREIDGTVLYEVGLDRLNAAPGISLATFPTIHWPDDEHFSFLAGENYWTYALATGLVAQQTILPAGAARVELGPNFETAFVRQNQLYIGHAGTENWKAVTRDGSKDVVYGSAVHREEFGIEKGFFWSPDGSRLAFYRMNQSMVTSYPLVDQTQIPAKLTPIKYPMAGQASHEVRVGIFDLNTRQIRYLQIEGPVDQYITNISWSPNSGSVYLARLNREQNHLALEEYEASSGRKLRTLFEEEHAKYIEPEQGPVFFPGRSNDFLWFSERDGYNHLYHYQADGTLVQQLTSGPFEVLEVLGFDAKGKQVFIRHTADLGLQRQISLVDIKKATLRPVTLSKGTHDGKLSPGGAHLLDTWSSTNTPWQAELRQIRKDLVLDTLFTAEDPLTGYAHSKMRFFDLKAEDGTPLHARLILPPAFDSTRKYPVFYYLYGGPHAQLIADKWQGGARTFLSYMAQRGYLVFSLDNRGSAYRGLAFEQATFRQLGVAETADQMVGVNWLREQPFVDAKRMAIHGWSYGGFMTINMMLRHPDAFAVAVCGGPVIDWNFYEVMYTERYMDSPSENKQGYEDAALQNMVGNLAGDLMVIQGLRDTTVVNQHIYTFLQACVDQDVQFDFFPYPRYEHHIRGRNRLHLLTLMRDYVDDRLKIARRPRFRRPRSRK